MDIKSFTKYIDRIFTSHLLPNLMNFIRIPNLSPGFDPNWSTNGLLLKAANLIISYAKTLELKNAEINLIQDKGYTPLVFIDIPASRKNDTRTVLLYAHYDKQPYGTGWDEDKSPTSPVVIDGRLYGRGSADDGYASFSFLTAIKACQDHNCPLPRICLIVEGAEESTDRDLNYYFNKLLPVIGENVVAFIPLDSGCSDYNRLWVTNSLRGYADIEINIQTLFDNSNYGPEASGRIAENLFILRKALDNVMDTKTGDLLIEEFYVKEIPKFIEEQIDKEVEIVKDTYFDDIPFYEGVKPIKDFDVRENIINNRWKPTLSILGIDNCPQIKDNGFSVKGSLKALLSIRIPPGIDGEKAIEAFKNAIKKNNYFGAQVDVYMSIDDGWQLNNFSERTKNILNKASLEVFGNELVFKGVGGSIPFITNFQKKYPNTDIICTGILGNDCSEHGPNENLNIDICKKMILVLCYFFCNI